MSIQQSFSGGVFCDRIEGGQAVATIDLSNAGIFARTVDGEEFSVTYGECQLEIGGFSGRMVFCRNEDRSLTIFCEDRGFMAALCQASGGILTDQLGKERKQRRWESNRFRMIVAAALVGFAVLLVVAYWGIRAGARAAVHALPVSIDKQIGKMAFESMDLGGPVIDDPIVVRAVQAMVDRMAPHAAEPGMAFDVHVVDSPQVNAFALPGGKIVVFAGLIRNASDAEQVAGVIGHEMAHVTLRHGLQRMGESIGIAAAINLLLGDAEGLIAAGAEFFEIASVNSYSRDHEHEADEEGVRMLHAAAIDPAALCRFFEQLEAQTGELPAFGSWLSTHPQNELRIAAIEDQLSTLPTQDYRPLPIDWDEVQRRVGK
jgi:predicted Zn-dependent protease